MSPRVALVSVGMGRVQRGFERFIFDLFEVMRGRIDITLFRSRGPCGASERIPPLLKTATAVARAIPLGRAAGHSEYNRDCIAFGLMMLPRLLAGDYDVIHCIDPPMSFVMRQLKRMFGLRSHILFTEGCVMPPELYPRVDHIHHVGRMHFENAVAAGVPASDMTLVPLGIRADRFGAAYDRRELRRKYGLGEDTFVVLAVSALERKHKRVDYIVEEVARLDGDVLLWLDGNPEDPGLPELARRRLGKRCRITHVPSSDVPELYRAADVLAHAALWESFGLAVAEALAGGTMVLAHDSPHFEWLVGDRTWLVDMREPGGLSGRLRELRGDSAELRSSAAAQGRRIRERFGWENLFPEYLAMYRKVASCQPARLAISPGGSR